MFTYFKICIFFLEYVSLGSGIDNILVTFLNVKFKFSFFQSYPYWHFFKGPSVLELSPVFPRPPSDAQLLKMVWVSSEVRAADERNCCEAGKDALCLTLFSNPSLIGNDNDKMALATTHK